MWGPEREKKRKKEEWEKQTGKEGMLDRQFHRSVNEGEKRGGGRT